MNRKSFFKSLLALPALTLVAFSTRPTPSNNSTSSSIITELKPVPNTKKFGIEVRVSDDGEFHYYVLSIPVAYEWFKSFVVPVKSKLELPKDFEGYSLNEMYFGKNYWNKEADKWYGLHYINGTWGELPCWRSYKVVIQGKEYFKHEYVKIHVGFLDHAAPVYNDTVEDRTLFWNKMRSIHTLYEH